MRRVNCIYNMPAVFNSRHKGECGHLDAKKVFFFFTPNCIEEGCKLKKEYKKIAPKKEYIKL